MPTSAVHYRFNSAKGSWNPISFDGGSISILDVKKSIITQNKLAKNRDTFDFEITNNDSNEVYMDKDMLPKNTSIIVKRVPSKRSWSFMLPGTNLRGNSGPKRTARTPKPRVVSAKAGELEKLNAIMHNSKEITAGYQQYGRQPGDKPPEGYVCHNCGRPGHWKKFCPGASFGGKDMQEQGLGDKTKKHGPNENEFNRLMLRGAYQVAQVVSTTKTGIAAKKQEYLCPICNDYLRDAVSACCNAVINEEFKCPGCGTTDVDLDDIEPNEELREAVADFLAPPPPTPEIKEEKPKSQEKPQIAKQDQKQQESKEGEKASELIAAAGGHADGSKHGESEAIARDDLDEEVEEEKGKDEGKEEDEEEEAAHQQQTSVLAMLSDEDEDDDNNDENVEEEEEEEEVEEVMGADRSDPVPSKTTLSSSSSNRNNASESGPEKEDVHVSNKEKMKNGKRAVNNAQGSSSTTKRKAAAAAENDEDKNLTKDDDSKKLSHPAATRADTGGNAMHESQHHRGNHRGMPDGDAPPRPGMRRDVDRMRGGMQQRRESEEAPLPMMKDDGIEKEDEEADQCQEDVTILDRRHHITGEMVEVEEAKTR
eukprot:jgi/Bigna1/66132/fgenesh1_pg.1_\